MAAPSNETLILRRRMADYLNCAKPGEPEKYVYMNSGFSSLNEELNPVSESKAYIGDSSKTTDVTGYEVKFPFDSEVIKTQEPVMFLFEVGRSQSTGGEAETDYIRAELWNPIEGKENTFAARKFRVSVQISSLSGEALGALKVSGALNNVGSFVDGEFNTETRSFTPKGKEPKPDSGSQDPAPALLSAPSKIKSGEAKA